MIRSREDRGSKETDLRRRRKVECMKRGGGGGGVSRRMRLEKNTSVPVGT
jgi:hypothetical protein